MNINRRQIFRDFDPMTCIAAALGVVFLAAIVEAGLRQDYQRQKGQTDDANTVDRIESGRSNRPETQPSSGRAATRPTSRLAPVQNDDRRTGHMDKLFDAIRQVESGGNDRAVGDGGRSVGPYQCGRAAWLDGGGKAADYPRLAYDQAETERVMVGYWKRYGATTDEVRSRIWNGGPAGMKKAATVAYWNRVEKELTK